MEDKLKQLKKRTKTVTFIATMLLILIFLNLGSNVEKLWNYHKFDASQFEVKLLEESGNSSYQLFVSGESKGEVDYNTYVDMKDKDGNVNYKLGEMISLGTGVITEGMLFLTLAFGLNVLDNFQNIFSRKNKRYVRIMAVFTGLISIMPRISNMILDKIFFGEIHSFTGVKGFTLFFLCLAILIWILGDVFQYGKELEDELNHVKKSYLDVSV
jgi:hypothetical protein